MTGLQPRAKRAGFATGGPARFGVTLIEMLVAMAISLIMMAAVANLFAVVGSSVSASRASITLSEQLRSTRNRLQADLAGITAPTLPPLRPENGDGYFEYFEGPSVDYTQFNATGGTGTYNVATTTQNVNSLTGDADDVLMFTTRSKDAQPFIGKYYSYNSAAPANSITMTVESQAAEVAWFTIENGRTVPISTAGGTLVQAQLFTLYRRVLLVAPEYNNAPDMELVTGSSFFNEYDLSAHYDNINSVMTLNSMSDLTKRENRFAHDSRTANFPFPVLLPPSISTNLPIFVPATLEALQPFWCRIRRPFLSITQPEGSRRAASAKTWCLLTCYRST